VPGNERVYGVDWASTHSTMRWSGMMAWVVMV
jgi:hypothetical protein